MGEFDLGDGGGLRTCANVKASVFHPGDRTVRLEVRVLNPRREVGAFVDDVGLGEPGLDVAT